MFSVKGNTWQRIGRIPELYDKIDVNENLEFRVFKDDKTLAYVKEPVAKTISDLISEMNRAIASYHAEFVYDGENFEYEYEGPGGILIKFLSDCLEYPQTPGFNTAMKYSRPYLILILESLRILLT